MCHFLHTVLQSCCPEKSQQAPTQLHSVVPSVGMRSRRSMDRPWDSTPPFYKPHSSQPSLSPEQGQVRGSLEQSGQTLVSVSIVRYHVPCLTLLSILIGTHFNSINIYSGPTVSPELCWCGAQSILPDSGSLYPITALLLRRKATF